MANSTTNSAPRFSYNTHDIEVIVFHCVIAAIQAILMTLGTYHFGKYDGEVALAIQVLSEIIRRFIM